MPRLVWTDGTARYQTGTKATWTDSGVHKETAAPAASAIGTVNVTLAAATLSATASVAAVAPPLSSPWSVGYPDSWLRPPYPQPASWRYAPT
jgi:hypothetical protein